MRDTLAFTHGAIEHVDLQLSTSERRIEQLEKELKQTNARLADLERRFKSHTHEVTVTNVGLLSEPINGRRVPLAINPRTVKVKSDTPAQ